jgi:hypothetical protein
MFELAFILVATFENFLVLVENAVVGLIEHCVFFTLEASRA